MASNSANATPPWNDRGAIQNALRETKQQPFSDAAVEAELERLGNVTALELERLRKEEGRLTYDDLPRLAELILGYESVADLYATHFGAVVVDEFQDLTPQQLRIVNRIGYKRTTYGGDLVPMVLQERSHWQLIGTYVPSAPA